MTQIFLVRHGEAEGNLYRRAQGHNDTNLTPAGREQAAALYPRFAGIELAAAYASDLRRARDTAKAALGDRPVPLRTEPRLREMCFGVGEDRSWGAIDRENMEQKTRLFTDPDRWHMPGGESAAAVQDRMAAALRDIGQRHEGGAVLCASHGMAIRLLLARLRGVPSAEFHRVILPGNTAVALIRYENGTLTPLYDNDVSHLPEPPAPPVRAVSEKEAKDGYDLWFEPFDVRKGRELYLSCYRDAWRQAHGDLQGFDPEACWRGAVVRAGDSPAALTAARRGEDFAGVLALDERRGSGQGIGWIAFLYVIPELRRRRCGAQLMGEAVARFRSLGRRAVRLTVARGNPALEFYKRIGFVSVGTEPGAVEPLLVMELRL